MLTSARAYSQSSKKHFFHKASFQMALFYSQIFFDCLRARHLASQGAAFFGFDSQLAVNFCPFFLLYFKF